MGTSYSGMPAVGAAHATIKVNMYILIFHFIGAEEKHGGKGWDNVTMMLFWRKMLPKQNTGAIYVDTTQSYTHAANNSTAI